jgi:predicted GNAT family acetyltransferase
MLRMHVEAVWGVRLPWLGYGDVEIAPGSASVPWDLYIGELAGGLVRIWRQDVARRSRAWLTEQAMTALALPAEVAPGEGISREVALRRAEPGKITPRQAGRIARRMTAADVELLNGFDEDGAAYFLAPEREPVFGVMEHGRLVSAAHSARRTAEACELGVETAPAARGHGYALAVTVLWAEAVAAEGIEPIYSALAANAASLALAHAAGYRRFARGVSVMRAHPPARGETAPHP